MSEAYLYCLPLNDNTLKIGCHLGDAKALDARYGTSVCREHLVQKVMVPVEPDNRLIFEQALHRLIRRHPSLHKEKEKYTLHARPFFDVYTSLYRLPDDPEKQERLRLEALAMQQAKEAALVKKQSEKEEKIRRRVAKMTARENARQEKRERNQATKVDKLNARRDERERIRVAELAESVARVNAVHLHRKEKKATDLENNRLRFMKWLEADTQTNGIVIDKHAFVLWEDLKRHIIYESPAGTIPQSLSSQSTELRSMKWRSARRMICECKTIGKSTSTVCKECNTSFCKKMIVFGCKLR